MRLRRGTQNLLIEPPSVATGDIAFNLLIFFLVCASTQPDSGRRQNIPRAESQEQKAQQSENIEVLLTRTTASINGNPVRDKDFFGQMQRLLEGKKRPEDKVVVVKTSKEKDTPYERWIFFTGLIERAGGVITLQLEEARETVVN